MHRSETTRRPGAALVLIFGLLVATASAAQDAAPGTQEPPQAAAAEGTDAAAGDAAPPSFEPSYAPVPASRRQEAATAAAALATKLARATSAEARRAGCWLSRLEDPEMDDRLIEWTRICPTFSREGLVAGRTCAVTAVQRDLLMSALEEGSDFDAADQLVGIASRLRSMALYLQGMDDAQAASTLGLYVEDVQLATTELAKLPANSRSSHYLAIRSWIQARQQDSKSLYSQCR
jgi:hypothetical protein